MGLPEIHRANSEVSEQPCRIPAGEEVGTQALALDPALKEERYLLSALLENTTSSIYFKDVESRFVRISHAHARLLKLSHPSEAVGKTDFDFFADEHAMLARRDEQEIIRSGQPLINKEERETWPDGSVTWASTNKMPLLNAAGEIIGTFGTSRAITQRRLTQQALFESDARFQELIGAIREVFWIQDVRSNRFLYVSPAYTEIWGSTPEQLYADPRNWMAAVHAEDLDHVREIFSSKPELPFEATFRIIRPDGAVRWLRHRGFPIFDETGYLARFAGITADITEARQAHSALVHTQSLLASIVNSSPDAIVSQLLDGTITTWNTAAERIFGYSADEVIGKPSSILRTSDQEREEILILARIRTGMHVQNLKTERQHKDGRLITVSLTVSPIRDEFGNIVGASTINHNLAERKCLEDKLSIATEHLRAVLETTNEFVVCLDRDWRITYINRLPEGGDPAAVIGKRLWDHQPVLLGTVVERAYRKAMVELTPTPFEFFFVPAKMWLSGVAYPTESGLLILIRDETEKRAMDDQLRRAQKMEAIGQLAAGIAHEINTPIQYVGDNARFLKESWNYLAELLSAARKLRDEVASKSVSQATIDAFDKSSKSADLEYLSEDIPRAIDQTIEGVQRIAKIVCAMKEFSHPGSEEKSAVDLNRAIETTLTIARNEWKYIADVRTDLDPDLPLVPCLAGEINQVFLNLIVNAAQAVADVVRGRPGVLGKITLCSRREGDWAEFSIRDTGTGIPEAARGRVFDPFFTTKEVGRGTGQGLTLVHNVVVKNHGGQVWFDTEVGRGTTFFVRLPLAMEA
jgi:PAS domain S-box-containing protein